MQVNNNTSRQDVQEIIEIIRQDDALREEVRRLILTEELLKLPTRFTALEDDVRAVKDDVSTLKEDVKSNRALLVSIGTAVGALIGAAGQSDADSRKQAEYS